MGNRVLLALLYVFVIFVVTIGIVILHLGLMVIKMIFLISLAYSPHAIKKLPHGVDLQDRILMAMPLKDNVVLSI